MKTEHLNNLRLKRHMSCVDIINISFHILVLTTIQFFQSDLLPVNIPRIIKLIIPCTCFYKKRYCENKYCKSQLNRYDNAHFEASEPCGCTFFLGRVLNISNVIITVINRVINMTPKLAASISLPFAAIPPASITIYNTVATTPLASKKAINLLYLFSP
jgi:hypothetical protein